MVAVDREYLVRRATQESKLAAGSTHDRVRAAHLELASAYLAKLATVGPQLKIDDLLAD